MTTAAQMIQSMADKAAALAHRDADLFGVYLADVRLLRSREYMVTRDGASFRVDGREIDGPTLRALADRERRLMAEAPPAAATAADDGRRIGDSEPLERRAPRRRRTIAEPLLEESQGGASPTPPKRRVSRACACGGCIPAADVLAIVEDLKRLLEQLARR